MKLTKNFGLILTALVLCSSLVGCKKGLQDVTPLPGQGGGASPRSALGDSPAGLDGAGASGTGLPYGAGTIDTSTWDTDEQTFADQTIYFDLDKSNIKPSEVSKLETVASRMQSFSGKALRIAGHCDERGTEEYNRSLGERRALSVREYLVRLGVDVNRVATVSYGEDRPVDPGHSEGAWAKNRRGQIILLSPPGGGATNP